MSRTTDGLPTSEHFEIQLVADGAYAAIATEGGAAFSNAGIIDLGDATIIFDTCETPKAAQDLRQAAEELTGRPTSTVIISHAHDDHWLGNQIFADHAAILSTHATREAMLMAAHDLNDLKNDPSELEEMIREDEERLRNEMGESTREVLGHSIARWRHNLEMLPTLQLSFPNPTFDGKLVFHGSERSAELLTLGAGHTSSDCFLVLSQEKVAFMGDLAFFNCQPFMADSSPTSWVSQLEAMERSEIEIFVPGHGPVGKKAEMAMQREYILVLEQLVARVLKEGGTAEDAIRLSLPEPFKAWLEPGRSRFESNVRAAFQRQTEE